MYPIMGGAHAPAMKGRSQAPVLWRPLLLSAFSDRGSTTQADNRLSRQGGVTAGGGGVAPGRWRRRCYKG